MQDFASSCRLGKCRTASGGKRWGLGKNSGQAHRTWAFAAAPVSGVPPPGPDTFRPRGETPGSGNALRMLAPPRGRAVSCRRTRKGAFARERFLRALRAQRGGARRLPGRTREAPVARTARRPRRRRCTPRRPEALYPCARASAWPPALAPAKRRWSPPVAWAAPPPRLRLTGEPTTRSQAACGGGPRARHHCSVAEDTRNAALQSPHPGATEPHYVCGATTWVGPRRQTARQDTRPTDDCAGMQTAEKMEKIRSQGECVS